MTSPTIILNKPEETFPFNLRLAQNKAIEVPKNMIKNALIDWKTEAGISKSPINRLVFYKV